MSSRAMGGWTSAKVEVGGAVDEMRKLWMCEIGMTWKLPELADPGAVLMATSLVTGSAVNRVPSKVWLDEVATEMLGRGQSSDRESSSSRDGIPCAYSLAQSNVKFHTCIRLRVWLRGSYLARHRLTLDFRCHRQV